MRQIIMLIQVMPQFLNINCYVKLKWGKKKFIHSFIHSTWIWDSAFDHSATNSGFTTFMLLIANFYKQRW